MIDISIVTVGMNHLLYLKALLHSIYVENVPQVNFEMIYVDNCSTDGTVGYIRHNYPQVKIIENRKPLGFGENNNKGVLASMGKYIAIINPDIVLHKRRSINYNIFCCEMKKASKPGQGDARKVKRLVRHINYHFGIDLYKINRTEARFTLYYLRTGYKQCQKEEYFFNRKTNQIEPLKV